MKIGDWGVKKRQLIPIGKSVSVSFRVRVVRACVRASEAKLREHARGDISSVAGGLIWKMCSAGGDLLPHRCDAIRKGFKQKTIVLLAMHKGFNVI